jgi:UDP-N-acetylmuramoyl-L-alanyl-D-glutamate--2,6-diaminopimelate ligase
VATIAGAAGDLVRAVSGDGATRISGLAYDSRAVEPGDLFFCVPGATTDGHGFAAQAVAAGASALVVERAMGAGVPEIVVSDARRAMARMASAFFGHPGAELQLIGVTGTNGKTTTAYLIESILAAAGRTTGLIGTVETRVAGASRPGVRTTPESLDLQRLLFEMRCSGVESVAMEVTSHALVLDRVEGLRFDAAAFTNLSQDHLDFHADMEDYFAAKRSLFVPERIDRGAANVDDPYGRKLIDSADVPCIGFGISGEAHVRALDVVRAPGGSRFAISVRGPGLETGGAQVTSALVGDFNVSNCLAAASAALLAGHSLETVARGLERLRSVPGRFESVDAGQPFFVVVDYAHTPDSLDNVLGEARRLARRNDGRVVCVFGCGGDRDRGKRPLMGAVAARRADLVIVTSDNPRSEDPHAIIDQILEGVLAERPAGPDVVDADRRAAIGSALGAARPGDVILIAGKGHETGQELADRTVPFDDREVARALLIEAGLGGAG